MSGYLGSHRFLVAGGAWAPGRRRRKTIRVSPADKVVSMSGDGGFGQYMGELTTAVKYGMSITHVIVRNDELGKISKEQKSGEWPVWETDLSNPSFAEYAELCGARGIPVTGRDRSRGRAPRGHRVRGPEPGRDHGRRGARLGHTPRAPSRRHVPILPGRAPDPRSSARRPMSDEKKPLNEISRHITQPKAQGASQAMLYATGLKPKRIWRSRRWGSAVGVVRGQPLQHAPARPRRGGQGGGQEAGLVGYRFNTIGVSDGISMGTEGMSYSLQSRDLIADSIETVMGAQWYDALVTIPGCDKNMPGCDRHGPAQSSRHR